MFNKLKCLNTFLIYIQNIFDASTVHLKKENLGTTVLK